MTCRGKYLVSLVPKSDCMEQECTENNTTNPMESLLEVCGENVNKQKEREIEVDNTNKPNDLLDVSDMDNPGIVLKLRSRVSDQNLMNDSTISQGSLLQVPELVNPGNDLFQIIDGEELLNFKSSLRPRCHPIQYNEYNLAEDNDGDFSIDNLSDEYVPPRKKRPHLQTDSESTVTVPDIQASKTISLITPSDLGILPTTALEDQHGLLSFPGTSSQLESSTCLEVNNDLEQNLNNSPSTSKKKIYPLKTSPGRKRQRNPNQWKVAVAKNLKNRGLPYQSRGKMRTGREIKPGCKIDCLKKCHTKITNEQRKILFQKFWGLGNHNQQVDYLSKYIKKVAHKTVSLKHVLSGTTSRRTGTYQYFLVSVDGNLERVCKKMFLDTYDVTDMWVTTMFKKLERNGGIIIPLDGRGKHDNRAIVVDETVKASIRQHINSIPFKESHYVRQRTSKLYFDESLTFPKLYSLYQNWMTDNNPTAEKATKEQYRRLFYNEFNIDFFKPKKDQCLTCSVVEQQNMSDIDEERKKSLALHIANKTIVRQIKDDDKHEARGSKTLITACFDLQKILSTPQSEISTFYYKRKFQVYNFTIFDIGNAEGYCYLWNESIGKKGPNEISSFLFEFIKKKAAEGVKEFRFYSDSCGGQNRNRIVFLMYAYVSKKLGVNITHNFFEVGHSQSEGDSMHALIERRKKNQVIYIPQQWYTLISCAKNTKPYIVKEICQNEIYDFKSLINFVPNWDLGNDDKKVTWSKVQHIKIDADLPHIINFQYNFYSEVNNFIDLEYNKKITRRQKSNKNVKSINTVWEYSVLPTAYNRPIPITNAKYKDLCSLCSSGAIPEQYHSFYLNLPHSDLATNDSDVEND